MSTTETKVFDSVIFSKGAFGSWKQYYAILWDKGNIDIYKNKIDSDDKCAQPITTIDISQILSVTFSPKSILNMIKFDIVTSHKLYKLASPCTRITNKWIEHSNNMIDALTTDHGHNHTTSGWLLRKTKRTRSWKRNWCTLTEKNFSWSSNKGTKKKSTIHLSDIKVFKSGECHLEQTRLYPDPFEIITQNKRYMFCAEHYASWNEWNNAFKSNLQGMNCTACNCKEYRYCSMKIVYEGCMIVNLSVPWQSIYYIVIDAIPCLFAADKQHINLSGLNNALIRSDCCEKYVLKELCVDHERSVDFRDDHEINFFKKNVMFIDGLYYEVEKEDEMIKWREIIERMQAHRSQSVNNEEDLCSCHLFLLIDGYCNVDGIGHVPIDICQMVLTFTSDTYTKWWC